MSLLNYKPQQKFIVYNRLKEISLTGSPGISPCKLAEILDIPSPTVRRILGKYLKEGKVVCERINQRKSLFLILDL